ncbi:MAG: type II toxin-antitoxin system RelE/ParE family toxin [Candidatus Omnitrophica bacterium]|nr:type II toxin-antitoxin system RelE/ParE family toxin [Candidatus Omnitrophota bacterium]
MKYQLFLTNAFLKKYEKSPQKIQIRVKEKLRILKDSPFAGKKLTGELTGEFSYRVGDYRIIYTIEKDEIFAEAIGHRKDIYRKSR